MRRFIIEKLKEWKESKYRKPLILKGARQVGKTYILKQFGEENYEGVAYFNFDHDEDLYNLFENTKDPKRILEQLAFIYGKAIMPEKTLIIFDEIQECPNALNSLKYFYEEANEYHIACAGSLLGIRLSHTSFPVGKVEFLNMYPMTFSEFLLADKCENLVEYMESVNRIEKIPDIFFNQLEEKLKAYFIIGGMPEAVNAWVNEKNMEIVNNIQENILLSYVSDFSKHTQESEANKISLIWNSIPSQLAKENKKFIYGLVKEGARAREYEIALSWLIDCGLVYQINRINNCKIPLSAYQDFNAFKLYLLDVGLLAAKAGVDDKTILEGNAIFEEFKGSLTEQYVLCQIKECTDLDVFYWSSDTGIAELDFITQIGRNNVPIEVKASENLQAKSLKSFVQKYNTPVNIRTSMSNYRKEEWLINIPLYSVGNIEKIINNN